MRPPRGQALVEFALILPLLLLLILGGLQVGIALVTRYELGHAVTEAAIAGASDPAPPTRCTSALAALAEVYGRVPDDAACTATGSLVEVRAGVGLPLFVPVGDGTWHIGVSARAEVRR